MKMRSVLKHFNIFNCILLAGILSFSYFVLLPTFTMEVTVPSPSKVSQNAVEQKNGYNSEQFVSPPREEYSIIAENNLLHPDRKIPLLVNKEEISVPRPDFVLYGILIADHVSLAYLNDRKSPLTNSKKNRRQTGLKVGETMSGYTLKEVLTDRVVMCHGDDRIEVKVIAPGTRN